jgi:hypothetical protein
MDELKKKPIRRQSSKTSHLIVEAEPEMNTAGLQFKAPQLIKFALDQIE